MADDIADDDWVDLKRLFDIPLGVADEKELMFSNDIRREQPKVRRVTQDRRRDQPPRAGDLPIDQPLPNLDRTPDALAQDFFRARDVGNGGAVDKITGIRRSLG